MSNQQESQSGINTKLFILDNLDSFTYNLVDEFKVLGFDPTIYRNTLSVNFILDKITQHLAEFGGKVLIVLSPGPGEPSNAGCLMELIEKSAGKYPILGICLGHQAIVQHYGGSVVRAPQIVHGKSSSIEHTGKGPFLNITNPLPVARYHSLVVTDMPTQLDEIAYFNCVSACLDKNESPSKLSMAIEHKQDKVLGFQFHPESILTTYGSTLLAQSIHYLIGNEQEINKEN